MKLAGLAVDLVNNAGQRLTCLVDEGDLGVQSGLLVGQTGQLLADVCLVRAEVIGDQLFFKRSELAGIAAEGGFYSLSLIHI